MPSVLDCVIILGLGVQGVPVNEVVVKPRPLTPSFFSDRIESVSNDTSAAMYGALLAEGCINSTGYLVDNPRCPPGSNIWSTASSCSAAAGVH